MFEEIIELFTNNPMLLGIIFAIARNIGGYLYNCAEARKFLPYSGVKMLETIALWESLLLILTGAGVPTKWSVVITLGLDFLRSVRKAVSNGTNGTVAPPA